MEASTTTISPNAERLPFSDIGTINLASKDPTKIPSEKRKQNQSDKQCEDFLRWRPSFHLIAPSGWMNDPCAPGYDETTGLYHVAFQWNPNGNDWGNIAWGHSTSRDLVSWSISETPVLKPATSYDCCGVFTGCFWPSNLHGEKDGTIIYIYTSVSRLPIHYTLPYVQGSESLSIATSHDGGKTWRRFPGNPILPGPPSNLTVTGWRDPFLSSWAGMKAIQRVRSTEETLYGFISGGILGKTPTVFVYSIRSNDLTNWEYIGHMFDVGLNFSPSRWSGDFGVNWEVANFVTLTDEDGTSRDFVIMGAEGCLNKWQSANDEERREIEVAQGRTPRSQLWMCGEIQSEPNLDPSKSLMKYKYGGVFDHGCFYAANSFWDPVANRQIVYGWITEEDLPNDLRYRQNWSGCLSLPRSLKLVTMHRVTRSRSTSNLKAITSIEAEPEDQGKTHTVRTLGAVPDSRLEKLRMRARRATLPVTKLGAYALQDSLHSESFLWLETCRWEVDCEFSVGMACHRVGFIIGHSDGKLCTASLPWSM